VTADGRRCAPTLDGGGDVQEDGFGLSIAFVCPAAPRELTVSMGVLRELLPGHRHVAHVHPRGGVAGDGPSVDAILTADAPSTTIRMPAGADLATAPPPTSGLWAAVRLGVLHILTGWDHLLFLVALLLGTRGVKPLALAVTAFTVAHSITLALAAFDVVTLSPRVVEPAIAASIAFVAFENAWRPVAARRWRATFVFGLVHGLGFAGALRDLALPRDRMLPMLLGFNAGVEVGQIVVVAALVPAIALAGRRLPDEVIAARTASIALGFVGVAVLVARIVSPS
jgi:hydrogenase/urease accessory protein HupE